MDLNQPVGELGYLPHLGWKTVIQAAAGYETREALVAPPRWSEGGSMLCGVRHVHWCVAGPGLCVGASVCAKAADRVINYLGQNSKISNKSLNISFLDRCVLCRVTRGVLARYTPWTPWRFSSLLRGTSAVFWHLCCHQQSSQLINDRFSGDLLNVQHI